MISAHLLIKGEQADVAIEFGRLQRANYRKQKTDADIAAANMLRDTIKKLNARGPAEVEN